MHRLPLPQRLGIDIEDLRCNVGGLDDQLAAIVRRAFATRRLPAGTMASLGLSHVKGILLYGPPGCETCLLALVALHRFSVHARLCVLALGRSSLLIAMSLLASAGASAGVAKHSVPELVLIALLFRTTPRNHVHTHVPTHAPAL